MLIVSSDELFALAIRQYLEDSNLDKALLDSCVIVDLDSSAENPGEKAVTFSRDGHKAPDLVRPFLMTDMLEVVKKRFSNEKNEFSANENAGIVMTDGGAFYNGAFIALTAKEREILALLTSRRGCAISREEIFKILWGGEDLTSNIVDVYIRYLRKKLDFRFGERIIYTRRGCGYYIK